MCGAVQVQSTTTVWPSQGLVEEDTAIASIFTTMMPLHAVHVPITTSATLVDGPRMQSEEHATHADQQRGDHRNGHDKGNHPQDESTLKSARVLELRRSLLSCAKALCGRLLQAAAAPRSMPSTFES